MCVLWISPEISYFFKEHKSNSIIFKLLMWCPLFDFLALCTTAKYTKDNDEIACGVLLNKTIDWLTAATECRSLGARLPIIKSSRENEDLSDLFVRIISHHIKSWMTIFWKEVVDAHFSNVLSSARSAILLDYLPRQI